MSLIKMMLVMVSVAAISDRKSGSAGMPRSTLFPYTTLFRSTVNTTGYIDHAAFLGTINPDTNKIPKHLFQGYLNIYNNYFKAPWMPDRTEANPNELNQDDARYGFRCCHL